MSGTTQHEGDSAKLDLLFDWADRMYTKGNFERVDRMISRIDISRMSTTLLYGFLVVTWWPVLHEEDDKLPSRGAFHERVAKQLEAQHPGLLKHLRSRGVSESFFTA